MQENVVRQKELTVILICCHQVEHRLTEIEMQICGASSGGSSTEDNERNRESII
jgi:hypothetical protein